MYDRRKSCDQCSRLKKKCDGKQPSCSRCLGKGEGDVCGYSNRRARTPTTYRKRRSGTAATPEAVGATKLQATYRGSLNIVLKRCRLSASPATGLVGMEENFFLSDFFDCVGFLPITTRGDVREAMVKIMVSATHQQRPFGEEDGVEGKLEGMRGIASAMEHGRFLADPSFCTFWSAVAIGALVKGRTIESVERYVRLARDGLARYTGPTNIEVMKAWTILGYLHLFIGDQAKFHEYLRLSDAYINELVAKGSEDVLPVGFPEVVKHGETVKLFTGTADEEEMESLLSQEVPFPEMCDFQTEAQLCKYIIGSHRAFKINIYKGMHHPKGTALRRIGSAGAADGDASKECSTGDRSSGTICSSCTSHHCELCPDRLVEMGKMLRGRMLGVWQLQDAFDSPGIQAGMGALVVNGTHVLERVFTGDTLGAMERLERWIEVLERYPGLTRSAVGTHMSHVMISVAANIDDPRARGLYDKLRAACNLMRPPGSLLIPSLEEWQGTPTFCDNIPCRYIENVLRGGLSVLHPSPDGAQEGEVEWDAATDISSGTDFRHTIPGLEALTEPLAGVADVAGRDPRGHPEFGGETGSVADDTEAVFSSRDLGYLIDGETSDSFIAAEDWLDVTHTMLNCVDP